MIHFFSGNDYSTDFAIPSRLFSYWYLLLKPRLPAGLRSLFKDPSKMKAFMAGYLSFLNDGEGAEVTRSANRGGALLETFYYIQKNAEIEVARNAAMKESKEPWAEEEYWTTMLDSGAFSAFTQGKPVDLQGYIEYIKAHPGVWDYVAALDVIGDAEASWANYQTMRDAGIDAIPCYHYGEPVAALDRMVEHCPYLAIGGVAQLGSGPKLTEWLDMLWHNHLTDQDGLPRCKVHGFAITGKRAMVRYPWASVDSSSWLQMAGRGVIAVDLPDPSKEGGTTDLKIAFSERSPSQERLDYHFDTLSKGLQQQVGNYLEGMGYDLNDLRTAYRWRQHVNIGYYRRYESRCVETFVRDHTGLLF